MIPATALPDVRSQLLEDISRPDRNPIVETYAIHLVAGVQAIADPAVHDPHAQAELLAAAERKRLEQAALYWVSPHMTTLTLAAAPGMPPFRPGPQDLPSRYGLIYFAAPFAEAVENPVADAVMFGDGTVRQIPPGQFQVCAATWGSWDYGGRWKEGGIWFTFYTARGPDERADIAQVLGIDPARVPVGPALRLDNECVVRAGCHDDDQLPELATRPDGTASWMHLVLTAFRLMATSRAASVTQEPLARPFRRRAARAGVARPDEPVRLVDITTRPQSSRTPGEGGRTYRVRWVVEGHWRNQWYPSRAQHRPRWIDSYIKGPEDAPLQVKDTVHLWRDPAEPAGGTR